ncbi:MAG: Ig-like domain-containing protein [Kofleriaceae bacterium]
MATRQIVINQVAAGTLSGVVVKARLDGATVTVYRFDAGVRGAQVGTGTTAADGAFTNLQIAEGTSGALLLETSGGQYAEDAQPATLVTTDVTDHLRTVIPAFVDGGAVSNVVVSPLTTLAVAYLEYLTGAGVGGADLAARWATAHAAVEAHFGVADIRAVTPSAPNQIDTLAAADRYGLVLVGISRTAWLASGLGGGDAGAFGTAVNAQRVTNAWVRDLADGCWDGKAGATALSYGGPATLTEEATRLNLAQAIVSYLGDTARNVTTFTTAADVLPLLDTLATGGGTSAALAPGACPGGRVFTTPGAAFDREGPAIAWTTPPTPVPAVPGDPVFVRGTFMVAATASDTLDPAPRLTITAPAGTVDTDGDPTNRNIRATFDTTTVTDGVLTVVVDGVDASGNHSLPATSTRAFTVDNTAPVVAITAPATDGLFLRPPVTLQYTVTEANLAGTTALLDGATPITPGFQVAAEGAHSLTVTATDRAGASATATRTFTVDSTAPVITLTAPTEGSFVRGPVTLTFAATDANAGTVVTATVDGAPVTSPHAVTAEGAHTLIVNATDAAGNAAATVTRHFTIDNTPPVISVSAPASGSFVQSPVTISFSATDANPGISVSATLDGSPFSSGQQVSTEGGHTLVVTATDAAGNAAANVSRTFTVDSTAPAIGLTAPAEGAFVRGPVAVSFMAVDANPGSTIVASLDGAPITSPHTFNVEGAHTLIVNATDAAGNAAATVTRHFTIDNTPPVLTVTAPASGAYVRGPVNITFSATDNFPPVTLTATLDGNPVTSPVPAINTEGSHTLVVTATDRAGNAAPTVTRTFTVDNTPPAISLTAPAEGSFVRGVQTLSFAATDANPGVTVTATLDGTPLASGQTVSAEGAHTVVVNATDAAGNAAATVTRHFTIDNTPPAITVTGVVNGGAYGANVAPTFFATDAYTASPTVTRSPRRSWPSTPRAATLWW